MAQVPPPPPPGAGGYPPPGAPAGNNKNLYTILAWALFPPIGSLIFLFVGKDDPDVKNNAAQATVIHGIMLIGWIIFGIIIGALTFGITALLWNLLWFIVWVVGLILALQAGGQRVRFPVLGPMVASYVPMVESWAK